VLHQIFKITHAVRSQKILQRVNGVKIPGCKRGLEWESKGYTEKTELHEACGYSYIVVRCDGEIVGSNSYRVKNAVEKFFSDILQKRRK